MNAGRANKPPLEITLRAQWRGSFSAYAGNLLVGSIAAWEDSRGEFVIMDVMVRKGWRRRGVATAMYRAVEEQAGRQLKPAVSLSDDGFAFWKSYRPEAVAGDLRHRPDLIGRHAAKNGRIGVITRASGSTAVLTYEDGMTSALLAGQVDAAMQEADALLQAGPAEPPERMRA